MTKILLAFGENDSRRLFIFLEPQMFWNIDHILITSCLVSYRDV